LTFKALPGDRIALVGPTGSGKSTALALLYRAFDPQSGEIAIDGTDIRDLKLIGLRRNIGVVFQETLLFNRSIAENLRVGKPDATDGEIRDAAARAQALEFIERHDGGLQAPIGERGRLLSGGERQRLAIARALLKDPPILILDEATSALDPESEALVNANLLRIARGRTMVIVSHRLSSLTECDQILVLEKGKVMDVAPHRVLLERCTVYRQLWAQQNRHLDSQGPRHAALAPTLVQGD
jgi:ATP-binding cassette subfamily B protein